MLPRAKIGIIFVLLFLSVSAFFIRLDNGRKSQNATIDEWIYFGLAQQMEKNPFDYHSIRITEILREDNPDLVVDYYMTQPLFKHPPLFPYFIAAVFKLLGDGLSSAYIVPAFFGALMIFLGYLMGRLFFDEGVGLAAAFLLWIDPVNIICSQKVWMESTLSFFMVLSVYLFACGIKYTKDRYFLWAGLAAGLAMLTKYTGGLTLVIMVLYAMTECPKLLRNRKFLLSLIIPVAMLSPWLFWNYLVYGQDIFSKHFKAEHGAGGSMQTILLLSFILGAGCWFIIKYWRSRQDKMVIEEQDASDEDEGPPSSLRPLIALVYGLLFIYVMKNSIGRSLDICRFPETSWGQSPYFRWHPLFYFQQLVHFSFLYFFSFLSFFVITEERLRKGMLLYLSVVVILTFYLVWGNYQSRYILAATPFLVVLGAAFFKEIWTWSKGHPSVWMRVVGQAVLIVLSVYVFVKVNYLNFMISYPNNMCYF